MPRARLALVIGLTLAPLAACTESPVDVRTTSVAARHNGYTYGSGNRLNPQDTSSATVPNETMAGDSSLVTPLNNYTYGSGN